MTPRITDPPTPREPEATFSPTLPAVGANGNRPEPEAETIDLDELLAYDSVPPRRTVRIEVCYRSTGKLEPLPYPLADEEGAA